MMMQTEKSGAKYPLVNGRHEFSDGGYIVVSNNHVLAFLRNNSLCNYSNIFQNTEESNSQYNISWLPAFGETLKQGDKIMLNIINLKNMNKALINFVIRISGTNQNILSSGNGNYTTDLSLKNNVINDNVDIGSFGLYVNSGIFDEPVEFDVEFTVNGERWI